jgi:translation initiation factor IF-3
MAHPELGRKILDDVIASAGPIAKVENQARMEGRSMSLVLSPDKQAQEALRKAAEEAEKKAAAEAAASEAAASDATEPTEAAAVESNDATEAPPEEVPGDE